MNLWNVILVAFAVANSLFKRDSLHAQDIVLVNTLDGSLHGIKKATGKLVWSKAIKGPNIKVTEAEGKVSSI